MAKKDPYQVLGVPKDADAEAIKKAHARLIFINHPNKVKNNKQLDDEGRAAAVQLYMDANEAFEVLGDAQKRAAYDRGGHAAVERAAESGQGRSSSQAPVTVVTEPRPDVMKMFDDGSDPSAGIDTGGKTAAQMEEEARAARRAARRANADKSPEQRQHERMFGRFSGDGVMTPEKKSPAPAPAPSAPAPVPAPAPVAKKTPPRDAFQDTATRVSGVKDQLADPDVMAEVPLSALEKFRESLAELTAVVDQAIASKKSPGRGFKR